MNEEDESSGDMLACGVCGEIREFDFGLLPCEDQHHWKYIACEDCRQRYDLLTLSDHYDETQHFQDYEVWDDDNPTYPFHLDEWIHPEAIVGSLLAQLLNGRHRKGSF